MGLIGLFRMKQTSQKQTSDYLYENMSLVRWKQHSKQLFVGSNTRIMAAAGGARDNQRSQAELAEVVPQTHHCCTGSRVVPSIYF
ncbi:hypothetical protein PoB_006714500 [Plakobranchus ocellatus]|uniref:Uncharacterized protein n=1 Tax=Plakobranchus ocellatus TaxID=259542 RepID=A0AAV4D999_9GAST|nr:hypothetical protein PoB_006714500 [Plakobranchus ocellatus]